MFCLLNKKDNTPEIFGSVSAICAKTELKEDALYYHFSRLKRTEFENEKYRIVKCKVVRALRS
jgi:hypothetical protein